MSRSAWHPHLTAWVDRVDARWQQLGLSPEQRRELRLALVTDLAQACLDGAALEDLLRVDPDRFATDVAIAQGLEVLDVDVVEPPASPLPTTSEPARRRTDATGLPIGRVVGAGLFGSVIGGVVGLALLFPVMGWVEHHQQFNYTAQGAWMLAIYVTAALVAAVCGGLAVASACADRPDRNMLGRRTVFGLVASGVAATIVTVSFARSTGYSTGTPVVLSEFALVIGICVIGLLLVAMSVRSPRPGVAAGGAE